MENQNHFFDQLVAAFSQERLESYLVDKNCNNSKDDALIIYSWNIELSKALYPTLQILEITLRNSLHNAIADNYQTEYWFNLPFLHKKEKDQVNQVKDGLRKGEKAIKSGSIIAELSFGFWTSLFDVRYEHNQILWPKLLKLVFPFLPRTQRTRSFLSCELNLIRRLRNRVFHYEPIWHWHNLLKQNSSIIHLIKGISPSAAEYLTSLDHFNNIHTNGKWDIKNKLNNLMQKKVQTSAEEELCSNS